MFDPEPYAAALFDRLKTIPGIKVFSRRDDGIEKFAATPPALVMTQDVVTPVGDETGPIAWTLTYDVTIFAKTVETTASPDTELNGYFKRLSDVLDRQPLEDFSTQATTLGGRVLWCRLAGPVEFIQGVSTGVGALIAPVQMLVPQG